MNLPSMSTAGADSARRPFWLLLLTVVFCLVLSGAVWAQDDDDDDDDDSGNGEVTTSTAAEAEAPPYVLPYALVIACVGLGTLLVCRSANRHSLTKKWKPSGLFGARGGEEEGKKAGPAPRTRQVSKDAQTGLYVSIAGLVPVVGLFLAAFGLWKSVQAKKSIAQNRLLSGEGTALAGIIVGAIMIVVQIVVTVVILIKALS